MSAPSSSGLQRMVLENRESYRTDFTVSVDAAKGVTTGISAYDRARRSSMLVDPKATPHDLVQPGHVFPLRAKAGGVLAARRSHGSERRSRAAGRARAGRRPLRNPPRGWHHGASAGTVEFRKKHQLKLCSIADLIAYRRSREKLVDPRTGHQVADGITASSICTCIVRWSTARIISRWSKGTISKERVDPRSGA